MTSSAPIEAAAHGEAQTHPPLAFRAQLATLGRGLRGAPERHALAWLAVGVFAVILLTAAAQVALNAWNRPFYNAIAIRDHGAFVTQLLVFFAIAGTLLVLNVVQMWLNLTMQLKLRAALMHDLLDQWLAPLRAFRLAHSGELGANPDQRLHEDTRHLAELSTSLAIGLLQATVLLAVFIVVLWRLSQGFAFTIAGREVEVPGYMVWAATVYALLGSAASFKVGYSLIQTNAERYGREAELRTALVRVAQQVGIIALQRGETRERSLIETDLAGVFAAMRKLVAATTRLTWVTAGYGWLTQVVPILVAAPVYFSGRISFGDLMVAVGAFNQVQSSLRWFVDNFGVIADWRATLLRVADFRRAVSTVDEMHKSAGEIKVERGRSGLLVLDALAVTSPSGCTRLKDAHIELHAGERLQITGDSGDAQTQVFRALAGLWPWGRGRIVLPGEDSFLHVARRPYVRPGRLRDILAYPADAGDFDEARFRAALEAVGLDALVARLDEEGRWDQDLGDQDLGRLAFARLPLQRPAWIIIDQALDLLDDAARDTILAMLETTLKGSAVINIGRADAGGALFARAVELIEDPGGGRLALPRRAAPRKRKRFALLPSRRKRTFRPPRD